MICSHCGADNKDDAIKCAQCGEPLKPAADKKAKKRSNASSRIRKISVDSVDTKRLDDKKGGRAAGLDGKTGEIPKMSQRSRGATIEDTLDLSHFHLDEVELKEEQLDDGDYEDESADTDEDFEKMAPFTRKNRDDARTSKNKKRLVILIVVVAAAAVIALCLMFFSGRKESLGYADLILEGNRYFHEGDYGKAEEYYKDALETNPDGSESYQGLADVYAAAGDTEAAAAILRQGYERIGDEELLHQAEALESGDVPKGGSDLETSGGQLSEPPMDTGALGESSAGAASASDGSGVAWVMEPTITADNILPVVACTPEDDVYSLDVSMFIQNGQAGLIREDGTVVAEPSYQYFLLCSQQLYGFFADGSNVLLNSDYTAQPQSTHQHAQVSYDYLWDGGQSAMYRIVHNGEESYVEEEPWQPGENVLVPVISGTRDSYTFDNALYAVAGSSGPVTDFIYEAAAPVSREGMIAVCRGGKWGFCNVAGSEVIPCQYESINWLNTSDTQGISYTQGAPYPFCEGYVAVKKDGMWGYLDTAGAQVLPFIFQEACPVHGQTAWVKYNDHWGRVSMKVSEEIPEPSQAITEPSQTQGEAQSQNGAETQQEAQSQNTGETQ